MFTVYAKSPTAQEMLWQVPGNTMPHQLHREVGTAISCTKCSQVTGFYLNVDRLSYKSTVSLCPSALPLSSITNELPIVHTASQSHSQEALPLAHTQPSTTTTCYKTPPAGNKLSPLQSSYTLSCMNVHVAHL